MKKIILTFISLALILNIQLSSLNGKFSSKKLFSSQNYSEDFSEERVCDGSDSENDKELKYFFQNIFEKALLMKTSSATIKNAYHISDFVSSISTPPPNFLS